VAKPDGMGLLRAELRARRDRGQSAFERLVWTLLLGDAPVDVALLRADIPMPIEGERDWHRTAVALLSGDRRLAAETAAAALEHTDRYVPGYREFVGVLLALVADDDETARANLAALDAYAATHDKLRSGQPASVAGIPRGLVDRDERTLAHGLDALMTWHARRARARSDIFNSARAMVSVDGAAAVVLAHERGMTVEVAGANRVVSVPILVVHVTEWGGTPVARNTQYSVTADLLAGGLLAQLGVPIEPPPQRGSPQRPATKVRRRRADAPLDAVVTLLQGRLADGRGIPWQLASWALLLGDTDGGRRALRASASVARRQCAEAATPNHNHAREYFALSLVTGDGTGVNESAAVLQAWMDSAAAFQARYAHADGYLDVLCDVVTEHRLAAREEVQRVGEVLPGMRAACVGLVERDGEMLATAIDTMLADHVRTLERLTSPPPAVCAPVVHLLVAAHGCGVRPAVDERYRRHPVPIEVRREPGGGRAAGRIDGDLTGEALWLGVAVPE
jgi:hypothetical protein